MNDRVKELLRERKRIMKYRWDYLNQDMDEDADCQLAISDIDDELYVKHGILYPGDAEKELDEQESKS